MSTSSRPLLEMTIPQSYRAVVEHDPGTPPPEYTELPIQYPTQGSSTQQPRLPQPTQPPIHAIRERTSVLEVELVAVLPPTGPPVYNVPARAAPTARPWAANLLMPAGQERRYARKPETSVAQDAPQLHPRCRQGHHEEYISRYSPLWIMTAILFFPLGLICLTTNAETKCKRCGKVLRD